MKDDPYGDKAQLVGYMIVLAVMLAALVVMIVGSYQGWIR